MQNRHISYKNKCNIHFPHPSIYIKLKKNEDIKNVCIGKTTTNFSLYE